ncbi:adenylate kinase 8-like [Cimex lectularius]|uniref:Adenylate kinase n=1 Tax=Cimex lectularius TaxID=79782 RepID=A0A8I6RXH1_CIMLE|nr:adenylate kinase 8-like [Cimex lectularius]
MKRRPCTSMVKHSVTNMGCGHSKDHPKNVDLVKLRKKYDTEPIKKAKLLNIWTIGGNSQKTLALAKLISEKLEFLLVTEDSLLQTEMDAESERGKIIKEVVEDKSNICPSVILDLVAEFVLENLEGVKGIVFHGIPRDREQAWQLQRLIGPVSLVVFCELTGEELMTALAEEGDEPSVVKTKVDNFQKCVLQFAKHKTIMKVDGTSEPENVIEEIVEKVHSIAK